MTLPQRLFLDTNVYIVGAQQINSYDYRILEWLASTSGTLLLISEALLEQVARVAKRQSGKDDAGEILDQIWRRYRYEFIVLEAANLPINPAIPREDWQIYLAAKLGKADCFVSSNRELVKAIAQSTGEFECLTPDAFVARYLKDLPF